MNLSVEDKNITDKEARIVCWQPVLTDHQAYTYSELSDISGMPITNYVLRFEDETRRAQGWLDLSVANTNRVLLPKWTVLWVGLSYLFRFRKNIHVFSGVFGDYRLILFMFCARLLKIKCYLVSEPYSTIPVGYLRNESVWRQKIKVLLRPLLYRFYIMVVGKGLNGIFCISERAVVQFHRAGMPLGRLYPYGYFVPCSCIDGHRNKESSDILRIAYVGSLIETKDLGTLIRAVRLARQHGARLCLDVYGPGDPSNYEFDSEFVRYCGRIPFGETQKYLMHYDVSVLPSKYDGWGVVVNESLCAGVPVVCSDQVGAKVLLEKFSAGRVFESQNVDMLSIILRDLHQNPELLRSMKDACVAAAAAIQPRIAAEYMLSVMTESEDGLQSHSSPWYS